MEVINGLTAVGMMPVGVPSVDRQSRRLYVGNIPAGISETEMQEFFNTAMHAAKAITRFVLLTTYSSSLLRYTAFP